MRVGYACIALGVSFSTNKSFMLKNFSEDKLMQTIDENLNSLNKILEYNVSNDIFMYRISSEIIPFGSHEVNKVKWWIEFSEVLKKTGVYIKNNNIRVSMHPGQYTVINTPREDVFQKSVRDLQYHSRFLNSLGVGCEAKLVTHVGGVYGDKKQSIKRWIENFRKLPEDVREKLVLENDERYYTIDDIYYIYEYTGVPLVYDNLHHEANPYSNLKLTHKDIMNKIIPTWNSSGAIAKVHYSNQDYFKKSGAHSQTIYTLEFIEYYMSVRDFDLDIMLEVKDKELSAIKCNHLIDEVENKTNDYKVEKQWAKYKYKVLERSQKDFLYISNLIEKKPNGYVRDIYNTIDNCLAKPANEFINAADHVFAYFKKVCSDKEKKKYIGLKEKYEQGQKVETKIKSFLHGLAVKYKEEHILDSYYFL